MSNGKRKRQRLSLTSPRSVTNSRFSLLCVFVALAPETRAFLPISSKEIVITRLSQYSKEKVPQNKRRHRKEEIDSLMTDMGLTPANKKNSKSRKQTKNVTIQSQLDYARNGHTVLRSFLDPARLRVIRKDVMAHVNRQMLDAWRQKVHVASDSRQLAQSCKTIQDCQVQLNRLGVAPDTLPFLQYFNTWRSLESVKTLALDLGQTASLLLDVPSVRLYQDSVFWKRLGDGPTPWHTDARMAPFDTSNILSFWISLEDVVQETGLIFCSKSHSDFALPFWNDFDGPEYQRLEERYRKSSVNYMPLSLGDVTVHSGWTLHCADVNIEENDRVALAISFVDARAEIRKDALEETNSGGGYGDNEDQWSYKEWVQDVQPRQQFRHALVPIVWPPETEI